MLSYAAAQSTVAVIVPSTSPETAGQGNCNPSLEAKIRHEPRPCKLTPNHLWHAGLGPNWREQKKKKTTKNNKKPQTEIQALTLLTAAVSNVCSVYLAVVTEAMPSPQHHFQQPQGCSLPAPFGGTEQRNHSSSPKSLPPVHGEAGARADKQPSQGKITQRLYSSEKWFLILFLFSNPPQWSIAFGGSGLDTCFGISLCRWPDLPEALGWATEDKQPDRQEGLKILKGHTLNLQVGSRLQDRWTVLHTLGPALKMGTDMNTFLPEVKQ